MTEDSIEQLKAGLAREPEVIAMKDDACEKWLREWVEAGVRIVRRLQLDPDLGPWDVTRILLEVTALRVSGEERLDQEIKTRKRQNRFWVRSRSPADHAAAIWDAVTCHNSRCECQKHKVTHCPAHRDSHPSFSVTVSPTRLLLHCHAGCTQIQVIDALRRMDLWETRFDVSF